MQHTLLPAPERRTLRREYRLRVAIVFCFMLSFAGLVGVVSLFPSFISMSVKERSELNAVAALKKQNDDSGIATIQTALKTDSALLAAASPEIGATRPSTVIESVVSARGPISITSIQVSQAGDGTWNIALKGVAPNRDLLLSFKDRLQNLIPGNQVSLPINELAKNSNIQFSLLISEKLP